MPARALEAKKRASDQACSSAAPHRRAREHAHEGVGEPLLQPHRHDVARHLPATGRTVALRRAAANVTASAAVQTGAMAVAPARSILICTRVPR